MTIDPLTVIRTESDRLAQVLREVPRETPVPSCPGWTADDLLWHLTEVHSFWGRVIGGHVTEVEDEEAFASQNPPRPTELDDLVDLRAHATATLLEALGSRSPDEPAWSWFPPDQTVDFTRRMQTHEATIHRVDAELTAGVPLSPIDPEVAAAGITHSIDVMRFWFPDWATITPTATATIRVTDNPDPHNPSSANPSSANPSSDSTPTWLVEVGRWTGTGPESGRDFDEPYLRRAPEGSSAPRAEATGTAEQLDLWLWGRPATGITVTGDDDAVAALRAGADAPLE